MKKIMVIMLVMMSNSYAQFFATGYGSSVTFIDRTRASIVGATIEQCEANRQNADHNKAEELGLDDDASAIDESNSTPCGQRSERLLPATADPLPEFNFPPRCLSCPMLDHNTFHLYYPDHKDQVTQVFEEFNIGDYNQQLMDLQKQYDLAGFEKAMFYLNVEINKEIHK